MPHTTKHAPKVSTRSVYPYARARDSLREKLQQDRQTHRRVVQNHFSRSFEVVHPKSGLISNSIFCTMQILPLTWK